MTMTNDAIKCVDSLKMFRIEKDGKWTFLQETVHHPTIIQRIKRRLGLFKCIDDRITNAGLAFAANLLKSNLNYVSVGTNATTTGQDAFTDLQTPIMARVLAVKSLTTTYVTNDTAQFMSIFVADNNYNIAEVGLHSTITGGTMYARQTSCAQSVTTGQSFGFIWQIANTR